MDTNEQRNEREGAHDMTNSNRQQNHNSNEEIVMGTIQQHTDATSETATARNTEVRFSAHALERMRQYDVRSIDIQIALGARIVDTTGAFTCRDATADHRNALLAQPKPAAPVRLGTGFTGRDHCRQRAARTVLLVMLPGGRRLHVVCVPYRGARLEVVSLWDPDTPENEGKWAPHRQLPTTHGARSLPYCRWLLADPFDPRRPTFS